MRRLTRAFIVLLVALAVPIQGTAAATMLHCTHTDESAHVAHDHGASSAGHHHESGVPAEATAAEHEALVAHEDPEVDGLSSQVHKCSACAASNVGLALPSTMQTLPEPAAAASPRPFATVVHATFLTSGLERPPRALFA
jgi:hypothetical protein